MTASPSNDFPAAISLEALQQLHKAADSERSGPSSDVSEFQKNAEAVSLQILEDITDKFENHMIPKVLVLRLINQIIEWAQANQHAAAEAKDLDSFASFTAMVAQLASVGVNVQNIYFGPDDFTNPLNDAE